MKTRLQLAHILSGSCLLAFVAACGGGGGGGDTVVSGTVLTPNGQAIPLQGPGSVGRSAPPATTALASSMPGLLPVPDGTPVELVRLDASGNTLQSLDDTATSSGRYSFDLTKLDVGFASDLAILAGGGATRMRALAVAKSVDVDPLSEAVLELVLQQGAGLAPFTVQEVRDLDVSVRLLATADSLVAQQDIDSTVTSILQAVQGESSLVAFFAASAAPGQTAEGPGDVGDYIPLVVGNTWKFAGSASIDNGPPEYYTHSQRVSDDTAGVVTIEEEDALDAGIAYGSLYSETSTALVYVGNTDPTDPLTPLVVPYDRVRFPLRTGDKFQQYSIQGFDLGEDLDGDGHPDKVDVRSVVKTAAFEEVTVPAGTFANCLRLDTRVESVFHLTSGIPASATMTESDWIAPRRGPVRTDAVLKTVVAGQQIVEAITEELVAYQVGDEGLGILPPVVVATDVSQANSDTETPGRPAVAFDGTNYLVVTLREGAPFSSLAGVLVTATGGVLGEFPLVSANGVSFGEPQVAFDGTNYLVVYGDQSQIRGARVGTDGVLLDPAGFAISTTGTSNFGAAIGFDGQSFLVTWRSWDPFGSGEIRAARVTPQGTSLGEFLVYAAPGDQGAPAISFDGTNYLVVWQDAQFGPAAIRAARVTPAGAVLDPAGLDIASGSYDLYAPQVRFDGARHLVIWSETTGGFQSIDVRGRRIEPDGTPTDPAAFPIVASGGSNVDATLAFDGTNFLVVWSIRGYFPPSGIHGRRVTPGGVVLDGLPDALGLTIDEPGSVEQLVHPAVAAGAAKMLLVWVKNIELSGEAKDVAASLAYPF